MMEFILYTLIFFEFICLLLTSILKNFKIPDLSQLLRSLLRCQKLHRLASDAAENGTRWPQKPVK